MLTPEFTKDFRQKTEAIWSSLTLRPDLYGFQFQRGTRWNSGLSGTELRSYERALGFSFPSDLKVFLSEMNGTDLETVNVYGNCGEPMRRSVGVYAYPRDLAVVQTHVEAFNQNRAAIAAELAEQGFNLSDESSLLPFYEHRYVVCVPGSESTVVLSVLVSEVDAIVYADSLQAYLQREFLAD